MTSKDVTNKSTGPLGLRGGPIIQPGATVRVDDWEKKDSPVLRAWIEAGALEVKAAKGAAPEPVAGNPESQPPVEPNPAPATAPVDEFTPKTVGELNKMSSDELSEYIETELKGSVKSGASKADLVKLAADLQNDKAKA